MTCLSIIIPVLNEANVIASLLTYLKTLAEPDIELIVVDGGSIDDTVSIAKNYADKVVTSATGRSQQMNAGAQLAAGDILLFLHADSYPPHNSVNLIREGLKHSARQWGRFDVRLSGTHYMYRVIATLINLRSRLSGIATGDQGIFLYRKTFEQVGGFSDMPLMEDIALSKALKQLSRPLCLSQKMQTSSRRWEKNGILFTILLMWRLRLAYALGMDVNRLAMSYHKTD